MSEESGSLVLTGKRPFAANFTIGTSAARIREVARTGDEDGELVSVPVKTGKLVAMASPRTKFGDGDSGDNVDKLTGPQLPGTLDRRPNIRELVAA